MRRHRALVAARSVSKEESYGEQIPLADVIEPPVQTWSGLKNLVTLRVTGDIRHTLRGMLTVDGGIGADRFQQVPFSIDVGGKKEFLVSVAGPRTAKFDFPGVGFVFFSTMQKGKLAAEMIVNSTDAEARGVPVANAVGVVVETEGPRPSDNVQLNISVARDKLERFYRKRIIPHMDTGVADRENEPVPCFDVVFEGTIMPATAYFSGIFATLNDHDALILPLFTFACVVEGRKPQTFHSMPKKYKAMVLARVCTLLSTTMEYKQDTTPIVGTDGEILYDACNSYETFLTWVGDCEEATLLAMHVFRWILLTKSDDLKLFREFAAQYAPIAVYTRIRSPSARAHHVHGMLVLNDPQDAKRGIPAAILLEGTTRTEGILDDAVSRPRDLPSNAEGERPLLKYRDGSVNGWYLDAICAFDAQAFGIGELNCTPMFPVQSPAAKTIGVPLVQFMQTPFLHNAPEAYSPETRQYAYCRALPECPALAVSATAVVPKSAFGNPVNTAMRPLADGEDTNAALLVVSTPRGRFAFE